jgi:hypothetical protein
MTPSPPAVPPGMPWSGPDFIPGYIELFIPDAGIVPPVVWAIAGITDENATASAIVGISAGFK